MNCRPLQNAETDLYVLFDCTACTSSGYFTSNHEHNVYWGFVRRLLGIESSIPLCVFGGDSSKGVVMTYEYFFQVTRFE